MKKFGKIFSLLFVLCLIVSCFGCDCGLKHKEPTSNKYFSFELLQDNTYAISVKEDKKSSLPENVILPSTFNDKAVTVVAMNGFSGTNIKKLSMPDSYTTIEGYAFEDCKKLEIIEWSESLKTIKQGAFSGCVGLKLTLIFPRSLEKIETKAFELCTSLTVVELDKDTCTVEEGAFDEMVEVLGF